MWVKSEGSLNDKTAAPFVCMDRDMFGEEERCTKTRNSPGKTWYQALQTSERLRKSVIFYTCYMDVSENRGTPKRMVYNGKPYWNGWFGGTTIFGNTHIIKNILTVSTTLQDLAMSSSKNLSLWKKNDPNSEIFRLFRGSFCVAMDVKWNQPYQTGWNQKPWWNTVGLWKKSDLFLLTGENLKHLCLFIPNFLEMESNLTDWEPLKFTRIFHCEVQVWQAGPVKTYHFPSRFTNLFVGNSFVGDFLNTLQNKCGVLKGFCTLASFKPDSNHIQTCKVKAKTKAFSLTKTKYWHVFSMF